MAIKVQLEYVVHVMTIKEEKLNLERREDLLYIHSLKAFGESLHLHYFPTRCPKAYIMTRTMKPSPMF